MTTTFVISDTHFGHANTWKLFKREDGSQLRPFNSTEEMDDFMVNQWNSVVGPKDKVYHLGDVVINRKALITLSRLNGDKVLIKGNHDIFKLEDYTSYFRDIRGYHVMDNMILCHIPVHPLSKGRFKANLHGHLHHREMDDPWYFNCCVENHNYTPVPFDSIRKELTNRL